MSGIRYNKNKLLYPEIPMLGLEDLARVATFGYLRFIIKRMETNWKLIPQRSVRDACIRVHWRHLMALTCMGTSMTRIV